jgi:hypothetical protein
MHQHEHTRGNLSWDRLHDDQLVDSNNLPKFIQQAAANDLFVSVRIGPYVCGEYQFGGIPVWVRELDGIKCFRCKDPVWEREMGRWVGDVVAKVGY